MNAHYLNPFLLLMTYVCRDSYLSTSPYKNQTEGDTSRFSNIDDIPLVLNMMYVK